MTNASELFQGEAKEPVAQVSPGRLRELGHDLRDRLGWKLAHWRSPSVVAE
jgi:hypothetical protein